MTAYLVTTLIGGVGIGLTLGSQPHMENALTALRTAKAELEVAEANKGGHRTKALNLVNQAITQVQKGINFAKNH